VPKQGENLTDDCRRILLSLPIKDPNLPKTPARRELFSRYLGEP